MDTQLEEAMWSGPCIGGPLDTQEGASRFPSGFLLVHRPGDRVWIYERVETPETPTGYSFLVRVAEGQELVEDPDAPENRFRAAEEAHYDVKAADWIIGPATEPLNAVEEDE